MEPVLMLNRVRLLFVAGLFLIVASPMVTQVQVIPNAAAAKKKKKKKKKSKKKASKSDEGKKEDGGEAKKGEELRTSGPAKMKMPFSEKKFDNSSKADVKRDEAIAEIRNLLPKMNGPQKGELVFRLAELYWEKSKYIYATEFQDFDKAYQNWVDEGRQGKEPTLTEYTKKSEAYKKQALANYSVVLDKYPDYPRLDEVLYIMAYNEYEAGKKKRAIKNYSKLIRQYKDSEYVADSYLALGEHYFNSNDVIKATKAYTKAYKIGKERQKSSTYMYALYKLAWCDYNKQEYPDALKKFKKVVKDSERARDQENVRLKREALNDMILTFAQLDTVEPAYKYFKKKTNNEEAFAKTEKLARVFKEQGKQPKEIEAYRLLLNLQPDTGLAPDYQSRIVNAYAKLEDRDAVKREVTRLVELYRPGSPWWRKNENDKATTERALTMAESRMRELVTDYHRYAQKFKRVGDYTLARDIYGQYLQAFPDSEYAYRLGYFYAEILWDLGEWNKAAAQYDNVVKKDPKGEYTRTAAYNAILAWEKIVKKAPKPIFKNGKIVERKNKKKKRAGKIKDVRTIEKIQKGKEYKAKEIPKAEVKLAAACDAYVDVVPDAKGDKKLTEELIVVKFKAGYIYQNYYHFDEAAKRFGELIKRWPASDYARQGADLIMDSYDAREDWDNLEKWARTFAKNKKLMGEKKFAGKTRKFMEGASFKSIAKLNEKATKLKKKKKEDEARPLFADAATRFEGFVKEFPKSQFAPVALYNATMIYGNANQLDLAIKAGKMLLKNYKKEIGEGENLTNKLEESTILELGGYYEKVADYPNAAERYLTFVDKYKKHEKAPDLLYNAALFYYGLGNTKQAVKIFGRYIKEYNKQKDVPAVYLRIARIYEDEQDWKRASALYGDFEKKYGRRATDLQVMDARFKTAWTMDKAGRISDARDVCGGILKSIKKAKKKLKAEPTVQTAGGYCAFIRMEPEFQKYKKIDLNVSARKVKKTIELKRKRMNEIGKKYVDILNYGSGEWGVAGLYRAAQTQLDFVKALREMPTPKELRNNPEAEDMFMAELENITFPVEEGAIVALEKALEKAFELGIYSDYTLQIEEQLKQFKPAEFGPVRELPFYDSAAEETATKVAKR
jgi:tetratricopeptide (TPR) repeat protein